MNANAIYRSKKLVKKLIRVGIAFRVLSVCSAAAGGPKCFPANLPALSLDLNGSAVLRRVIRLLVECNLPITRLDDVLHDDHLRRELLAKSGDATLQMYFVRQFPSVPKQTIAALSRRLESLFSSRGVRLALAGLTAPDLKALQDAGNIVLVGCFGQNMSRSVRQLLQSLVLSSFSATLVDDCP